MASEKVVKLIEDVKSLTVMELSELVKELEEEFGVSAAAPVAVAAAAPAAGAAAAAEEKTEFDVVLAEAKALVDGAPKTVKEAASKDEAEEMKKKLEDVGAKIELK